MAVLPPQSAKALPKPCEWYMKSEDSPIIEFYPKRIQYDPNGKPVRWLWIALLSFIDEKKLLEVCKEIETKLTEEEKKRNEFRPDLLYVTKDAEGYEEMDRIYNKALEIGESQWPAITTDAKSCAPTTSGDVRGGGELVGSENKSDCWFRIRFIV